MKKTLKLVLLASDKEHKGIYKHSITGKLSLYQDYFSIDKNWYPQNLYAISDEEVISGDFVYDGNTNKIYKAGNIENCNYFEHIKKVVITTDESLSVKLPTFTNDFINTYIERYNNEQILEQVEVEYDCDHSQMPNKVIDVLKINPDNTVDVQYKKD